MNQVKQLTHQEQVKLYNQCPKEELIEMLIEANKLLNQLTSKNKSLDVSSTKSLDYKKKSKEFDHILTSHSKEYVEKWLENDQKRLLEETETKMTNND